MKILLVMPRFAGPHQPYDFPLGIAYISSALKQAGMAVHCLNLNQEADPTREVVKREVRRFEPDICATGGLVVSFGQFQEILEAAREAKPTIRTILGGGAISSDPRTVAEVLGCDCGILGEGEDSVVEAVKAMATGKPLSEVAGLIVREGARWLTTPSRPIRRNISELPWPDFAGFHAERVLDRLLPYDNYAYHFFDVPRALPIIASRSCPFACTFCFHPNGRIYRERDLDEFFREARYLIERYRLNLLMILDELLAYKKPRLLEFCAGMKTLDIKWMCQLHAKVVDEETTEHLREAGCLYISLGLESMSLPVLTSMRKKATPSQLARAVSIIREKRVGLQGNFLFGDPAETLATAMETMDWWAKHPDYQIAYTIIRVFPGSPVFEAAVSRGVITDRRQALLAPLINVTDMDQELYAALYRRISTLNMTILNPSELLAMVRQPEVHPDRGVLYTCEWRCRFCQEVNRYRNISPPTTGWPGLTDGWLLCLTCRNCLGRSHVMNVLHQWVILPEVERRYQQAREKQKEGMQRNDPALLGEAFLAYQDLIQDYYTGQEHGLPRGVIYAAYHLGGFHLDRGNVQNALILLRLAVIGHVWQPDYHLAYGHALLQEGSHRAALLHYRMAMALLPDVDPTWHTSMQALCDRVERLPSPTGVPAYFVPTVTVQSSKTD